MRLIERSARTCYKTECKITGDIAETRAFVRKIIQTKKHESTMEHAVVTVRFVCDRGCCYSEDTEVLTCSGWKYWESVAETDKLACLSDSGELTYQVPTKLHHYQYDGNLLSFQNTSLDLLVTPNHRMWVFDYDKRSSTSRTWKFVEARNLSNSRYKFQKGAASWSGRARSTTISAHPTKYHQFPTLHLDSTQTGDLFELLGIWITDGSYHYGKRSGSSVQISQTKPHGIQRIRHLCKSLGLKCYTHHHEHRIDNLRFVRFVETLFGPGAKTFTAFVPDFVKMSSSAQIRRFLDGVILGDGNTHQSNGHQVVYTSSPRFAGDLQDLFLKVGLSANIRTIKPRERGEINGVKVQRSSVSFVVSVHRSKRCEPLLYRRCAKAFGVQVPYSGPVYCAEVPGHRLYVRRNGKTIWCGNSHEIVRHRLAAYSQESTRYCNYGKDQFGKEITVIRPPFWQENTPQYQTWERACASAEREYFELLALGCSAQEARSVLPNSLKTEIVMTANLREWKHVFKLRCDKTAHPQMRQLMVPLMLEFKRWLPEIYDDILPDITS